MNICLPAVVLIDGLDECGDAAEEYDLMDALLGLQFPPHLKFIVCSRPENEIRRAVAQSAHVVKSLSLSTVDKTISDADIRLYLESSLAKSIPAQWPPGQQWPPQRELEELVQKSNGLFAYASSVCRYLASKQTDPWERMKRVVNADKIPGKIIAPLDELYTLIMQEAFDELDLDAGEEQKLLKCLRLLTVMVKPGSLATISILVDLHARSLRMLFTYLHSVLHIPEEDDRDDVVPYHIAFFEYLADTKRAKSAWVIDRDAGHRELTRRCLTIMDSADVAAFLDHPRRSVISNHTTYVLINWAHHLSATRNPTWLLQNFLASIRGRFLWLLEASGDRFISNSRKLLEILEHQVCDIQKWFNLSLMNDMQGVGNSYSDVTYILKYAEWSRETYPGGDSKMQGVEDGFLDVVWSRYMMLSQLPHGIDMPRGTIRGVMRLLEVLGPPIHSSHPTWGATRDVTRPLEVLDPPIHSSRLPTKIQITRLPRYLNGFVHYRRRGYQTCSGLGPEIGHHLHALYLSCEFGDTDPTTWHSSRPETTSRTILPRVAKLYVTDTRFLTSLSLPALHDIIVDAMSDEDALLPLLVLSGRDNPPLNSITLCRGVLTAATIISILAQNIDITTLRLHIRLEDASAMDSLIAWLTMRRDHTPEACSAPSLQWMEFSGRMPIVKTSLVDMIESRWHSPLSVPQCRCQNIRHIQIFSRAANQSYKSIWQRLHVLREAGLSCCTGQYAHDMLKAWRSL
jgi:hypothetical protein